MLRRWWLNLLQGMSDTPNHYNYNPKSPNAMFALILARLDEQDKTAAKERQLIKDAIADVKLENATRFARHDQRLDAHDHFIITHKAKVAVLILVGSGAVSFIAWLIQFFKK